MLGRDTLKRHADLVDRMATARGVDLEKAALRGEVRIGEIDDAVLACAGCSAPDACTHWLAETTAPQPATPSFCRNAELFERLTKG
ncbi:hypothetical protein SAMN05444413_1178 [Roseivivax marinus]|uniref:DUF6455 family protein n=1 Tax=Roseivivax marinus TaxID=1379903 RepID=UPI0008AB607D|nr:DUF6455 family protein [Roseivivax marinus]SEL81357.1 hypothetical protein SAMN05444413_1178 [Roseivivax marinus]